MSTIEFDKLLAGVRGLYWQHFMHSLQNGLLNRESTLEKLNQNFQMLDGIKKQYPGNGDTAEFEKAFELCTTCDPIDATTFPNQIQQVIIQLTVIAPASDATDGATLLSEMIDPVLDEAKGLLQTQTANITNHYEDLKEEGAAIDDTIYEPLATQTSLAASTLRGCLSSGQDTISFAELQKYKRRRQDVITAPADLFLDDLGKLKDYLLALLKTNVDLFTA